MAKNCWSSVPYGLILCILTLFTLMFIKISARPTTFVEDFKVAWSESHIRQTEGGKAIQLVLDQSTGCGFASKRKYLFGRVSMKIKLVPGDSAGTVTAFYMNSDTNTVRDELDFEFLGNRSGEPYSVQTNIFAHGKGDREQRVNLWFDPSLDFHTYTIFWSHKHIVFYVDLQEIVNGLINTQMYNSPGISIALIFITVGIGLKIGSGSPAGIIWKIQKELYLLIQKNEAKKIPYPTSQPMGVYSTLWEADDWATRGGLEKIDWSKAPFYAYYKDFDIEGCPVPGPTNCPLNPHNWWEGSAYESLNAVEARLYRWVRVNHMVYDYCTDRSRFPVPPPECHA